MLTNKGLVEHAKMALSQGWGYVWGTFGLILSESTLSDKILQYPTGVGGYQAFIRAKWLGKRTVDCVGLIKSYMWWRSNGASPVTYDPKTDLNADGMYKTATEKGPINTLPKNIPGICLWKEGHIGVYIGNGLVIEARGTIAGVVESPLTGIGSSPWTHWLKCPFITYEEEKMKTYVEIIQEVSNGSADEWIKGIDTAVAAAKADGNLGALEIFRFLPTLIEKIGNK